MYRREAQVSQVIRWDGSNLDEIRDFAGSFRVIHDDLHNRLLIHTWHEVPLGWVVLKTVTSLGTELGITSDRLFVQYWKKAEAGESGNPGKTG